MWRKAWRALRWLLLALAVFYAFGLALDAWHWWETPAAVERIHARAVSLEMVMGVALPPAPRAEERDRTIAGVDVNGNGVRDDVEIEIHRRHADSAKIRAAQLQYAMALQSQLTDVFSEGTLVAAVRETGRGKSCIWEVFPPNRTGLPSDKPLQEWTREELDKGNEVSKKNQDQIEPVIKEVEDLVLNTENRKLAHEQTYDYMTSYGGSSKTSQCDIALDTLPN